MLTYFLESSGIDGFPNIWLNTPHKFALKIWVPKERESKTAMLEEDQICSTVTISYAHIESRVGDHEYS
jgi:hypothetical protein